MASIEEKFNAAVNVIKGLPKNGSYQPSSAMMLTFYSYFKQATLGPCKQKKPAFWDIVGRAKWDAYNALGEMSKERAMLLYVDELKKIIETMSYTENVANFVGSVNELDNINFDDLETVAPEIMKKAKSHPNSPFASRCNSPRHSSSPQNGLSNGYDLNDDNNENYINSNGHNADHSDDEYIDTVEDSMDGPITSTVRISHQMKHHLNEVDNSCDNNNASLLQQILAIVQRMNNDINNVNQRINILERHTNELRNLQANQKLKQYHRYPHWWPFADISPTWFIFLILWPFLAQRLTRTLQRRK